MPLFTAEGGAAGWAVEAVFTPITVTPDPMLVRGARAEAELKELLSPPEEKEDEPLEREEEKLELESDLIPPPPLKVNELPPPRAPLGAASASRGETMEKAATAAAIAEREWPF